VLAGQTHLVEIDLRRGGQRPTPPELPECAYYALISRYDDRPTVGFWPIDLRDPLPVLPVPLAAPDAPVRLDLKAVLDRAYDDADYGKYIYQETPSPPLSARPPTGNDSTEPTDYERATENQTKQGRTPEVVRREA
jgi:hypothetical protein